MTSSVCTYIRPRRSLMCL